MRSRFVIVNMLANVAMGSITGNRPDLPDGVSFSLCYTLGDLCLVKIYLADDQTDLKPGAWVADQDEQGQILEQPLAGEERIAVRDWIVAHGFEAVLPVFDAQVENRLQLLELASSLMTGLGIDVLLKGFMAGLGNNT